MSNPDLAELREKVIRLAKEIEAASESDLTPDRFFPMFLDRLVAAVGARGAVVWLAETGVRPAFQVGLPECGYFENPEAPRLADPLLRNALATGESAVYLPGGEKPTPTKHLYTVAALLIGSEPVGAVAVLHRAETPPATRAGILQFVEQMAGFGSRYLSRRAGKDKRREPPPGVMDAEKGKGGSGPAGPFPQSGRVSVAPSPSPPLAPAAPGGSAPAAGLPPAFWTGLEKFLLQLERGRTVGEVASTAASDGRLLLGVDRVSVARRRGRKTPIEAVSGQDKVNARANLIRRLSDLCATVMQGREPLVYTGTVEGLPPQVEQPLADYVAESKSRLIVAVPLFEPGELVRPEHEDKEREPNLAPPKVIGCLVAELINDSRLPPTLKERLDVVADHVAVSLYQARNFERIFLRRTLLAVGRTGEWFHGRKLAKTLAILAGVTAVGLALWLVPYPYRVTADGQLMPVVQRDVFAPWDGEVTELRVKGGEQVKKGELLAVLRNDELRAELARLESERNEKRQTLVGLAGQIDEARRKGDREAQNQAETDRVATAAEVGGLDEQIAILEERRERLNVVAPIDGVVATFQLDQLLRNRPVRRGESLMEIMDADGPWHLELDVEDRRMGHLLDEMKATGTQALPVEFVLATNPETTYDGHVERVATRAETEPEEGNVVRIDAAIEDQNALRQRRIGAEVRAKIDCGPAPLGYVLFGDVVEFLRKYLWL